jgi:formylglycine-generating enzyme required for sulfatase activity
MQVQDIWRSALRSALLGVAVAPIAISLWPPGLGSRPLPSRVPAPDLVELQPGAFRYRASGEFTRDGKPTMAPMVTITMRQTLAVMRHQVTAADYQRCIEAGACSRGDRDAAAASDHPVVKVSWRDAQAYASWLSRETGVPFRLPTDEEWAYAAGERFNDDALPESSFSGDPALRALAIYERDASRAEMVDKVPLPIGSWGINENGLLDVAGNVWEWTDTCFARNALNERGEIAPTLVSCGVRVVEGRHRSYIPDFIADARGGGCSVSTPPSNLGFRLVRDADPPRRPRAR